jgi:hypothetical protein
MEACAIDLSGKKVITIRERRERFWIAKLERLPCFEQIVKRLVDGQSISSVARWARVLGMDCELKNASLETWRKYINALSIRIRTNMEARPELRPKPTQAIIDEVKAQADAYDVPLTENGRKLWRLVEKAAKELNAEIILKYLFVVQERRVDKLLELEKKMGLLLPEGYKELAVLTKIAAEIRKYEVGNLCMNCQRHKAPNGVDPRGPLPHDQTSEIAPREREFKELTEVDLNRRRVAADRLIDWIQQDANALPKIDVSVSNGR